MNHIYRRIWSKAKRCWVVASEVTPGEGRKSRCVTVGVGQARSGFVLLAAVAACTAHAGPMGPCSDGSIDDLRCEFDGNEMLASSSSLASRWVFPMSAGTQAVGPWSTVFGDAADAPGRYSGAFGYGAKVQGDNSAAFGYRTNVSGEKSAAFGPTARIEGMLSAAMGYGATAKGGHASAFGAAALADGVGTVAVGHDSRAYALNSIAIGSGSRTLASGGGSSIAIGGNSSAGSVGSIGAIAVGAETRASLDAVAIGYGAKAYATSSVALGIGSQTVDANTVSVGSASIKRRIVNVQPGSLISGSTDAVTGDQLYNTNQHVISVRTTANTAKTNADTALGKANLLEGLLSQASGSGSIRVGGGNSGNLIDVRNSAIANRKITGVADATLSTTSTDAVTGKQLNATSTKLGVVEKTADAAKVDVAAVRAIAQAAANRIDASILALGKGATAENGSYGISTALGNNAKAYNGRSVALGDDARAGVDADGNKVANQNAGVSIGAGTRSANGAVATGFRANASGNFSIAVGGDAKAEAEHAMAVGNLSKASASQATALGRGSEATAQYASALGNLAKATKTGSVALGDRAQASHENAVALGAGAVTASANSVSVGSASRKRKIQYIADGVVGAGSTDAITGNQLHATNQAVTKAQTAADGATTTANAAKVESGNALAETVALGGLVNQAAVNGNVRVGEKNSGTVLDVRNSANANRTLTGVADGAVSTSSDEAINGRQLNAANERVATVEGIARSAGTEAGVAKGDAAKALAETAALRGLVAQVSATGSVRLGEKNSGSVLDVRNSTNGRRKISGVADGLVSGDSAEAISGRQLHETNSRVSNLESSGQFLSIGKAPIIERAEAGLAGVALGNAAKAGADGGTAVGTRAVAMGRNSVAVGRGSTVFEGSDNGFALGAGAEVGSIGGAANGSVALGAGAKVANGADSSLALGQGAEAREGGVASFGNAILQRRLVNIARGTADHNATTVAQLRDSLATLGGGAGMDASGNIIAPTYTVQGGTQNTIEDALMALDGAVITAGRRADKVESQLSSIFQESPSARADGMSQIAMNGVNGMVLTNLADGRVAQGCRDAVTGNQLYAAEQKISQNRSELEAMRKEREMGQQAMREMDANGPIDFGGARLTGVADGSVSGDSHDVVTGRQLFGVSDRVSKIEHQGRFLKINTDELSEDAFAGFLGVAIGDSAMTGVDGGTALGAYARALGDGSVALGRGSGVSADAPDGFAVGVGSRVHSAQGIAIGLGSVVESGAAGSLALGAGSAATEVGVASFGNPTARRRLVNIANGTANHNAATVGQLRGALSALGGEVDANGNIVAPRFNVQGQAQSTLNGALEALDGAVVTNTSRVDKVETQLRSVFQETPSVRADGVNQLTLAGASGMVISNVANGLIAAGSRDAVNGGQLHSMQQQLNGRMDGLEQRIDDAPAPRALASSSVPKPQAEETSVVPEGKDSQQVASVGEGDKPAPQPKANKDNSPKPQVDTAELEKMLARANEYTDGAISNFERRLDKMDKRFNRMAAMSSAQTAMAMNTAGLATYNRLGAGVGYSEGESAMAVGYQRVLNEKGSATFSLNGAFTNSGERSMGVGVGIGW